MIVFDSLSVGIIFGSYCLHVKYRPFLEIDNEKQLGHATGVYVRCQLQAAKWSGNWKRGRRGHGNLSHTSALLPSQTIRHNTLESAYLMTSMFILLAGMAFQSGVTPVGGGPYVLLTVAVAGVLVASVATFAGVVLLEVYKSTRFARRQRKLQAALKLKGVQSSETEDLAVQLVADNSISCADQVKVNPLNRARFELPGCAGVVPNSSPRRNSQTRRLDSEESGAQCEPVLQLPGMDPSGAVAVEAVGRGPATGGELDTGHGSPLATLRVGPAGDASRPTRLGLSGAVGGLPGPAVHVHTSLPRIAVPQRQDRIQRVLLASGSSHRDVVASESSRAPAAAAVTDATTASASSGPTWVSNPLKFGRSSADDVAATGKARAAGKPSAPQPPAGPGPGTVPSQQIVGPGASPAASGVSASASEWAVPTAKLRGQRHRG